MKENLKIRDISLLFSFMFALTTYSVAQKPNILFLFSDDHTTQAIGAYKSWLGTAAKTPNIDRLAQEGVLFKKCYVTNSICGPSRAVIQTGKHSHINGFRRNSNKFNGNQQTFPKILRQSGYQTAIIGKWHLGSEPQGFDHYEVMNGQGNYNNPTFKVNNWSKNTVYQGYNSDIVADRGLEWLKNTRDKSKPFMLMLQFKATHMGWVPPAKYYRHYDSVTVPEPSTLLDKYAYRGSAAFYQDLSIRHAMPKAEVRMGDPEGLGKLNSQERSDWTSYTNEVKADFSSKGFNWNDKSDDELVKWKYHRYIEAYLATGLSLDDNIGRVLKFLDDNGLTQNTVVMYSSDQGFYLGEHGWFDKRFMYEQSLSTPFIVRWPGMVTPGTINSKDIVSNLDFAETFLEIAGASIPTDMQGASLVPVLKGNTPADWRKSFYYQYWEGATSVHKVQRHYGVTTGRYKLIYFHDVDEWEFYDLKKDPNEMINQYYIPENDSIIKAMKNELTRLRTDLKAADEGTVTTPPKITVQRWTTPLPLSGCADSNYLEFDSEVDTPDSKACITAVSSSKRLQLALESHLKIIPNGVQIDVVGKYQLTIYDMQGNMIKTVKRAQPSKFLLPPQMTPGVLFYKLQTYQGVVNRRGIKI